jgi:hypothetical protein
MAFAANRIKVSTTTTGTDPFGLGSATSAAFRSFSGAGVSSGATVHYAAYTATEFECGEGVYTAAGTTLSRDTIFASSNAGLIVTFGSSPTVIVTPLAEDFIEILTDDLTLYVRADGADTNTGRADNAGGAFLTVARAMEQTQKIHRNGYVLTVQSRLTSQTATVSLPPQIGAGTSYFIGDATTPTNRLISVTGGNAIETGLNAPDAGGHWIVQGFELRTTTSGDCVYCSGNGIFEMLDMNFGACAGSHMYAIFGTIRMNDSYAISGGAEYHKEADVHGHIHGPFTDTVTITNTPDFSEYFATAWGGGTIEEANGTYTGSATGKRFWVAQGGNIITWSSDVTYYPGDEAGLTETGGIYDGLLGVGITSHSSAAGATDIVLSLTGNGLDNGGAAATYANLRMQIVDPTNGSLDGAFNFRTPVANSYATRLRIDGGLYHPSATGTDKGNNTINFGAVYDDNSLLTCYPWPAAETGKVDFSYWDSKVDNTLIPAEDEKPEHVVERVHEPARKFAARLGTEYDPTTFAGQKKHIEEKKHLTPYPNPDKYIEKTRPSVGEWVQRGVEMDELLFLYINELEQRIAALEGID